MTPSQESEASMLPFQSVEECTQGNCAHSITSSDGGSISGAIPSCQLSSFSLVIMLYDSMFDVDDIMRVRSCVVRIALSIDPLQNSPIICATNPNSLLLVVPDCLGGPTVVSCLWNGRLEDGGLQIS